MLIRVEGNEPLTKPSDWDFFSGRLLADLSMGQEVLKDKAPLVIHLV